jgi:ABC-type uncharacterized transport system auxiliary subunit
MMRFLSLVALLTLTACVSVLPEQKAPEALFRFGMIEERHALTASVSVREPEASRVFAGRSIAAEGEDGGLRYLRGVQWTDNATRMLQLALIDSLGGAGGDVAFASETGAPADFELAWRISDFTLIGDKARCRLEATLMTGRGRTVVAQTDILTDAISVNASNAARAKALTDAGLACVSEVAAFVSEKSRTSE